MALTEVLSFYPEMRLSEYSISWSNPSICDPDELKMGVLTQLLTNLDSISQMFSF